MTQALGQELFMPQPRARIATQLGLALSVILAVVISGSTPFLPCVRWIRLTSIPAKNIWPVKRACWLTS